MPKRKEWEPVYTVKEGAAKVKVSEWTMWGKLRRGEVKRSKVGGRTVIRESELMKLIVDEVG